MKQLNLEVNTHWSNTLIKKKKGTEKSERELNSNFNKQLLSYHYQKNKK